MSRVGQNVLFPLPFFKQGTVLITRREAGGWHLALPPPAKVLAL